MPKFPDAVDKETGELAEPRPRHPSRQEETAALRYYRQVVVMQLAASPPTRGGMGGWYPSR